MRDGRRWALAGLAVLLHGAACVGGVATFRRPLTEGFLVRADAPTAPDGTAPVDVRLDQAFDGVPVAYGDLHTVSLQELTLEAPDLSIFTDLRVIATLGLSGAEIAWRDSFPQGATAATLSLHAIDLTPFVLADTGGLRVVARVRPPAADTTVTLRADVKVSLTAQGVCRAPKLLADAADTGP